MKAAIITSICLVLALLTVLSSRLIIPALIIIFKAIEESFAPEESDTQLALAAATDSPVSLGDPPVKAPAKRRTTRKRSTKAKAPAAVEV